MNKLLWSSSLALATAAFLTACGDELCGGEDYDPTKYDCVDNEKQEKKTCKGIQYNPENEFCAMRESVEIGTYKMVTIVATTNNVHISGAPLNPRMKKTRTLWSWSTTATVRLCPILILIIILAKPAECQFVA